MNLKNYMLLFLIFTIIMGCKENKNKVSVISIDDNNYYSPFKVDSITPPQLIKADDSTFVEKVKSSFSSPNLHRPNFIARLFINEKGELDKIAVINGINNKLNNMIIDKIKSWKFSPAKKNGNDVKYQETISLSNLRGDFIFNPPQFEKYFTHSENQFFVAVESMPQPVGGIQAIQKNVVYPETAKKAGIEGKVYIKAFIDENGNVVGTEVLKGVSTELDKAAEDAIKKTKFIPGMQRGEKVKVQVAVPIIFKLE